MKRVTIGWQRIGQRLNPRNWRVPTRLTALIIAPTFVAVLLAGMRIVGSIDNLDGYRRASVAAEYSVHLRDLAEQLALERDLLVWGGGTRRKFNVDGATELTLAQQQAVVDPLATQVLANLRELDDGFGERTEQQAQQVVTQLENLAAIRKAGSSDGYTALIARILRLHDEFAGVSDDAQIVGRSRALAALAHVKEEVALQRAMLTKELLERYQSFTPAELEDFLAAESREQGYLSTFYAEAPTPTAGRLVTLLNDNDVVSTELTKSWAVTLGLQHVSLSRYQARDKTTLRWFQNSTKKIQQIDVVQRELAGAVLDRARQLQSTEQRNALVAGGLIFTLLLLVLAHTALIARSMVIPLRRLRAEALDVAGTRLPEAVQRIRESDQVSAEPEITPIAVGSGDEIDEVAQAFDEVHRQAVRLAAEEARLRANVNAMFVNLSRRTQTLVERQIALIDKLERGEEDGRRLADLFKLDHLATRMRRNSENLLVLAGHEPPRKRTKPARLVDVIRASLSEVEDYERVELKVHRSIAISGHAVNDVIHLVAELIENALSFSPRDTKVIVSSVFVDGGAVMLGVSDSGIGMSHEELAEVNRKLADPPTVDASVAKRMGLFVVGRLAMRHGIRVQLRANSDGTGVVAMVLFPPELVHNADQPAGQPGQPMARTSVGLPIRQPFAGPSPSRPGPFGADPAGAGSRDEANGLVGAGTGPHPWPTPNGGSLGSYPPITQPFAAPVTGSAPPAEQAATAGSGADRFATGPIDRSTGGPFDPAATGPLDRFGTGPFDPSAAGSFDPSPSGPFGRSVTGALGRSGTGAFDPSSTGPLGRPGSGAFDPSPSGPLGRSTTGPIDRSELFPGGTGPFPSASSGTGPLPSFSSDTGPLSSSSSGTGPLSPPTSGTGPLPPVSSGTGPLPSVSDPTLQHGDEYLPIYAEVESAWFRRPERRSGSAAKPGESGAAATASGDAPGSAGGETGERDIWRSRADSGCRAAANVVDPRLGGVTAAGLPKRTPKANLVPGSVAAETGPASPRPPVSAEAVRSRLSSFQQGIRRGRAEVAKGSAEGSGKEEEKGS